MAIPSVLIQPGTVVACLGGKVSAKVYSIKGRERDDRGTTGGIVFYNGVLEILSSEVAGLEQGKWYAACCALEQFNLRKERGEMDLNISLTAAWVPIMDSLGYREIPPDVVADLKEELSQRHGRLVD